MEGPSALVAALDYLAGGLSVIPIRPDGSKAPTVPWDDYKEHLATEEQVRFWWATGFALMPGIGIVGGAVSGNLGILDVEFPDFTQLWCELVEAQEPGLVANLPRVITPGKTNQPGTHFYFRSPHPLSTGKLARLTPLEAEARTGDKGKCTAIELKAEGGYCLAPGSPSACHESGRVYQHVGGPFLEEVPTLTAEQVELILSSARAIDRCPQAQGEPYVGSTTVPNGMARPGDVFNQRADWQDVLLPHGWVLVKDKGVRYWRRPGKDKGISATTGYCRSEKSGDLMCVFSSNAGPLEIPAGKDHQCFSKFAAFAILNHDGDFMKAAKDLAEQGYGFDFGMSEAQQYARRLGAAIKDVANENLWAGVRCQVQSENLTHSWQLSATEISAVVEEARQYRIESDPRLLAGQVQREINESIATPPPVASSDCDESPWKLVILGSEPPQYLLRSPFWRGRAKVKDNGGFIRLAVKDLDNWAALRRAAIEQAECSPPAKLHGWSKLLQQLLDHAEHRIAIIESRRSLVVAEFLLACLRQAVEIEETRTSLGSGGPQMMENDKIIVKSAWLVQQSMLSADGIKRQEIMETMMSAGMKAEVLGTELERSRWWTIEQEEMMKLCALCAPCAPKKPPCAQEMSSQT